MDWLARNLPVEGTDASTPTIGRYLRHDVITAHPDEAIADVRARVASSPYHFALVTTADGTLLGRLRGPAFDSVDDALPVSEAMEPGPSTLRPHQPVAATRTRLDEKGLTYVIVTDPDGHLLGTVHLADLPSSAQR